MRVPSVALCRVQPRGGVVPVQEVPGLCVAGLMFDPGQVMSDVEKGATRLETAADEYSKIIQRFEEAENIFEMERAKQRTRIYEEAVQRGEKVPAEDVRDALSLQAVPQDVRVLYAAAKATKEAQAVRFRALLAAVSARQSLLKALGGQG